MHAWIPFLLFSVTMAITPGPTNILIFAISARHGWKAAVPAIVGAGTGVAIMLLLAGLGLRALLLVQPAIHTALSWLGVAWLSWLAWKIFRSPPPLISERPEENQQVYLGFIGTVGLQWVNPKAWIMALTAVTVFAGTSIGQTLHTFEMALLFFVASQPCVGAWAAFGASTSRLIHSPRHLMHLNRGLALLLLISAWMTVLI